MKLGVVLGGVFGVFKKHEGTILTVCTMASTLSAVYFAFRDAPKVVAKLDELRDSDKTNFEKVKELAPILAPTFIATGSSLGFSVANHRYTANAINTLSNMVTLANASKAETLKVTEEVVGKEKADEIRKKVSEHMNQEASYGECPTRKIIHTGHGDDLFYDKLTNNWLYSDINYIRSVCVDLSESLSDNMEVLAEEYAGDLGVPLPDSLIDSGWSTDRGQRKIRPNYTPYMLESGKPYIEISFRERDLPSHL